MSNEIDECRELAERATFEFLFKSPPRPGVIRKAQKVWAEMKALVMEGEVKKTIEQLLDEAKGGSAAAARAVADRLRVELGMNYAESADFVLKRRGIDARTWEELLLESAF